MMAKPSDRSPERKLQVVLSVLRGELTAVEAARRGGVSEQTVHNWKRAFVEAGREGLVQGQRRRSSRELELEAENEELKAALGEACTATRTGLGLSGADAGSEPADRFAGDVTVPAQRRPGRAGLLELAGGQQTRIARFCQQIV